ncbi:MAG: serine/threonine protein kinase, partial [bacterium]|nr:serine/threonine protein kinase [Candidatus Kapabacteria bacterium]
MLNDGSSTNGRNGNAPYEERTINGYVLHEEIGAGGMSRVYRATREGTNQLFAVKAIRIENVAADFERRLRREPEVQKGTGHENIVELIDWFRVRDEFFLVMELVDGRSLSELIYRESGPMPFERARGYMRQILRAVNHLHNLGIVHRDIKPSNILVRKDDCAKLADFGIAKFTWQQGETKTQKGLGTPEYMSPEQARGTHIDHRSDIYSIGITFFEMLTARKPFARGEETPAAYVDVIQSILTKPLPDPRTFQPSVPAGAVQLLNRAAAKDASDRYQSATEFLAALDAIDPNDFSPATVAFSDFQKPVVPIQRDERDLRRPIAPPPRRRSRAGLWITLSLLAIAAIGYGGYQLYQDKYGTQSSGTLDAPTATAIVSEIASDYRTYSLDHNASALASLFAPNGNTYFSMRNVRRSSIEKDAQKFFASISATTIYDVAVDSVWAPNDSTINSNWLFTYERVKEDGAILRGQTLDRVRISRIDGEWFITRQTAVWVKRKNEPAPPLEEPEVIDIPEPIDSVVTTPTNPDDGFHVPPDTATVPSDNNP